jgi:hypothetical protein
VSVVKEIGRCDSYRVGWLSRSDPKDEMEKREDGDNPSHGASAKGAKILRAEEAANPLMGWCNLLESTLPNAVLELRICVTRLKGGRGYAGKNIKLMSWSTISSCFPCQSLGARSCSTDVSPSPELQSTRTKSHGPCPHEAVDVMELDQCSRCNNNKNR